MSRTIDYKIRISSDPSGARSAASALSDISAQANGLQTGFMSVQQAASGNVMALFSVVRALRSLSAAATTLQSALPLIGILIGVLTVAWNAFRASQQEAARAMQEANDKLIASQERLSQVLSATRAPNYNAQISALRDVADAFQSAETAAQKFHAAQREAASIEIATRVANIQHGAARQKQRFAGDDEQRANADLTARRAVAAETYQADLDAIESEAAAQAAQIKRYNDIIGALQTHGEIVGRDANTPLKQAEKRLAEASAQRGSEMRSGAESPETNERFAKAFQERERLQKESDAMQAQRQKQLAEADAALTAAKLSYELIPARKEQLASEYAAQEAADLAAESERVAARDRKRAEDRERQRQQDLRDDAEGQKKAVRKSAEQRSEEISTSLPQVKEQAEKAAAEEQRLRARILDPAARKQQDDDARSAAREEKSIESRIRRAESAKARGQRGKWIDDTLAFRSARDEAESKKQQIQQLEIDRTEAAKQSRDSLANIEDYLEAALQMSGGQGA